MRRRDLLVASGVGAGLFASGLPRLAFAAPATDARLVVVILRGGMDGLAAVPALGDPDHERARAGIAIADALKIDADFGLHPRLEHVARLYAAGEALPIHACCVPYHGRSHFDAQNVLENGSPTPYGLKTGWLNRALTALPARDGDLAVAIAQTMPVVLRGDARVTSWYPSRLPPPAGDTIDRIEAMYANDPKLAGALAAARRVHQGAGSDPESGFPDLMRAAGGFLARPDGPRVALLESTGWDTHANELGPYGPIERNLRMLDAGVAALASSLGDAWKRTAVLAMTEFGRTVAMNGTRGTDHGTGGAAFLIGGAVKGGRVLADWPGLQANDLLEGRDLRPTTDLRAIMKSALVHHLGVPVGHVEDTVFPESRNVRVAEGLFRT